MIPRFSWQERTARLTGLVCIVGVIAISSVSNAQTGGTVGGLVTDTSKGVVPGVRIMLTASGEERTVISNAEGRYEFRDLPMGTYTLKAELAGFQTVERSVVVSEGATTSLPIELEIGCLDFIDYADRGWRVRLQEAAVIVQIRMTKSQLEPCLVPLCICSLHEAVVIQVLKGSAGDISPNSVILLRDEAGHDRGKRVIQSYDPSQEYIAFLGARSATNRFAVMHGGTSMLPVIAGRVEFHDAAALGFSNGMSVEDFNRALDAFSTMAP